MTSQASRNTYLLHHCFRLPQGNSTIDAIAVTEKDGSTLLSSYIEPKNVSGDTAEKVTFTVGKFCDTGGSTTRTPGWMYETYLDYFTEGIATNSNEWDSAFLDQTGRNVNTAVNGIAKLLVMLSQ